jgi:hypothetical protein
MNHLIPLATANAPALVTAAGDRAPYRFLEFFTAQICNPHTRRAYVRAVGAFCAWLETHGIPSIAAVGSIHVAAYVEDLGHRQSAPIVKQHLAAIRCVPGSAPSGGKARLRGGTQVGKAPPSPEMTISGLTRGRLVGEDDDANQFITPALPDVRPAPQAGCFVSGLSASKDSAQITLHHWAFGTVAIAPSSASANPSRR